jgi:hypothetical protein
MENDGRINRDAWTIGLRRIRDRNAFAILIAYWNLPPVTHEHIAENTALRANYNYLLWIHDSIENPGPWDHHIQPHHVYGSYD